MPENIWFTADTHFLSPGVLKFRPFKSVEEHDETIIARWNAVVSKQDRVYFLGDLGGAPKPELRKILDRLKGRIHAIEGNHDESMISTKCRDRFVTIKQIQKLKYDETTMWLSHYPLYTWPGIWKGYYHLHGHTHGNLPDHPLMRRLDVGVDANDFRPLPWEEVDQRLRDKPIPIPKDLNWNCPL